MKEGGIYIHIPFCRKKCSYCDFYTGGVRIADWDVYISNLLEELKNRLSELTFKPVTLYLGGGTPSLIPKENLNRLISGIKEITRTKKFPEFTIEANPEDINQEKCLFWENIGINRVSLGVQSLNDDELKICNRNHNSVIALNALETIKKYFENFTIDLIFGLPAQNLETWNKTIDKILEYEPKHISSYSLMLEPSTALTKLYEKEKIVLPDENTVIKMWESICEKLKKNGFQHYEISNFSLPGFQSRHNNLYWKGNPYIGLGPAAHSYDGFSIRKWNPSDIRGYNDFFNKKREGEVTDSFYYETESLNEVERLEEYVMTRLRLSTGINLAEFEKIFGKGKKNLLLKRGEENLCQGLMEIKNGNLTIKENHLMISDRIIISLFD